MRYGMIKGDGIFQAITFFQIIQNVISHEKWQKKTERQTHYHRGHTVKGKDALSPTRLVHQGSLSRPDIELCVCGVLC